MDYLLNNSVGVAVLATDSNTVFLFPAELFFSPKTEDGCPGDDDWPPKPVVPDWPPKTGLADGPPKIGVPDWPPEPDVPV